MRGCHAGGIKGAHATKEDGAEVIVLGCAGLADLRPRVEEALRRDPSCGAVAVVKPVASAVEMAAPLARQRVFTATRKHYTTPKGFL